VNVHAIERLLHVLQPLRARFGRIVAMLHERPQPADIVGGPEGAAEQSVTLQTRQPLNSKEGDLTHWINSLDGQSREGLVEYSPHWLRAGFYVGDRVSLLSVSGWSDQERFGIGSFSSARDRLSGTA
jgi:hypothetical protein